jgi:hypothetical protein
MTEETIEEAKPDQQVAVKKTTEDYIREQYLALIGPGKIPYEETEKQLETLRCERKAHKAAKKGVTKAKKGLGELTSSLKGLLASALGDRMLTAVPWWLEGNREATFHFDVYPSKGHLTVVVRPSGEKGKWDFTKGFYLGTAFCSPKEDEERAAEKDPEQKQKKGFHPDKGEVIARVKAKSKGLVPLNLVALADQDSFCAFLMNLLTSEEFPTWLQKAKRFALIPRGTGTSSRLGFPASFPPSAAITVLADCR